MKLRFGLVVMSLVMILGIAAPVEAVELRGGKEKNVVIGTEEVINDNLFVGGEQVRIDGVVNGDVFVGGGQVAISGTINGDLWVGAGMVEITGMIRDDVLVGTGNLTIRKARIGDDLTVGAGNVLIDDRSTIGGSLVFGTGMLVTEGKIEKSLIGGGGQVTIDGVVNDEVTVGVGQLVLGSTAQVGGDVLYASDEQLRQDSAASVSGELRQIIPNHNWKPDKAQLAETGRGFWFGFQLWSLMSALVVGWLLAWLVPDWLTKISLVIREKPMAALGWGFLICVLIMPVFIILLLTVIGIPLAFILLMLFFLELYLAKLPVALLLGNWLTERFGWSNVGLFWRLGLGLVVYYLLAMLPLVGGLVWLVATLVGLGAVKLWVLAKKP